MVRSDLRMPLTKVDPCKPIQQVLWVACVANNWQDVVSAFGVIWYSLQGAGALSVGDKLQDYPDYYRCVAISAGIQCS